jgi:hypothetical protein
LTALKQFKNDEAPGIDVMDRSDKPPYTRRLLQLVVVVPEEWRITMCIS